MSAPETPASTQCPECVMSTVYRRRLIVNAFNLFMSLCAMAFGMVFLLWILWSCFARARGAVADAVHADDAAARLRGGLANAIYGSVVIVAVATFISTPIGILAGIYLAEYGKNGRIAVHDAFINDILLSAPSIVIGLFVYTSTCRRSALFRLGRLRSRWR
jgi:phosphate transport system permease protein